MLSRLSTFAALCLLVLPTVSVLAQVPSGPGDLFLLNFLSTLIISSIVKFSILTAAHSSNIFAFLVSLFLSSFKCHCTFSK